MQSTVSTKVSVQNVSPDLAQEWLRLNSHNRPLRRNNVAFFIKIIRAGQFMMTGEPVQFEGFLSDDSAVLMNGQHRLTAVAQTGMGQQFVVVEGVAPGSQLVMDTGKKRSFGDALALYRNVQDASAVASVVKLGYLYDAGRIAKVSSGGGSEETSNQDLMEWFDKYPEVKEAQVTGRRIRTECGFSASGAALVKLLFDRIDTDDSDLFFGGLITGAGLSEGDPRLAARNWIRGHKNRGTRAMPRATDQAAILIKTWNDWKLGRIRQQVKFNRFIEDFPVPV